MRGAEHQVVEDCLWGETAPNKKYGFAIPEVHVSNQGEQIQRPDDDLQAVRAAK